ncbi:hypothetical protein [Dyella telluris]|uniref:Protein RecA n=1 Tax=Dyella telluris TaxID=2763498 RepID=A0A7G8Q4Q6_9GAMM|nr:hypothetical protein [Dyella telluris]QNK01764.1 hypothetical protein H8F01_00860 [Dyella telluris]
MSKELDLASLVAAAIGENDEQQEVTVWLDTGYAPLNEAISGDLEKGLPGGRLIEIFGPPSAGKTAIATAVMKSAQQMGGIAMFNDHERSFDIGLGVALGLDPTPGRWVYKMPRTFEQSIDDTVKLARAIRAKKAIPDEAPIVAVFDSLASMVPQSKLMDDKGEMRESSSMGMHDNLALAKATSTSFPALMQHASELNICLIFLNQQRQKPGVAYGDPTTTPGGNAPEFFASVRIQLSRRVEKDKKTKEVEGQAITAVCKKNKVNRPFLSAEWDFKFMEDGTGKFDVFEGTLEYMKAKGYIETSGSYVIWEGKSYHVGPLARKLEAEMTYKELVAVIVAAKDAAKAKKAT